MEAVRTSETSVDNYFTRQYIPEDNSEHQVTKYRLDSNGSGLFEMNSCKQCNYLSGHIKGKKFLD
jgi:hypothetical protein